MVAVCVKPKLKVMDELQTNRSGTGVIIVLSYYCNLFIQLSLPGYHM